MKKRLLSFPTLCALSLSSFLFYSCGDEPVDPSDSTQREKMNFKRTVLLYAVASNNLYSSCEDDMLEILKGAESCDLNSCSMLVYMVGYQPEASLMEVVKNKYGEIEYHTIKEYDRNEYSTDPRRLSEVISDVNRLRKSDKYGLILWSHGTGWSDSDIQHPALGEGESLPVVSYSFGMDSNGGKSDYMNIDELAKAIPSGMFDFIWFDACYMSGIETVYQLRDKCDTFVGYPTEVWSYGMPYDQTLPLILKAQPNLIAAADVFTDYYKGIDMSWTIAVVRTSGLDRVAETARDVYKEAVGPVEGSLIKYSRSPCGPFYDFGQMTSAFELPQGNNTPHDKAVEEFKDALADVVLYKSSSEYNFNYPGYGIIRDEWLIDTEAFSGLNCRYFHNADDLVADGGYYLTLDWYKDAIAPSIQ